MDVAKLGRTVGASFMLIISQSLIFGIATLPPLLFWQFITNSTKSFPFFDPYGRYVLIAMSLIPAYVLFSATLMFLSAGWNRLAGWRTEPGEYAIHDYGWNVIKWAAYNASINIVRVFCGEIMRSTPLWTYYLKANGAKIGEGVYVNTARLFDHNLLVLHDKAVVGGDAKLIAHLAESGKIKASRVVLHKRAVVGVNTVIGPGVEIGENAAVGAMSFVPKGTQIPAHEVWGGVPARLIKRYTAEDEMQPGIPIPS